MAAWKLLQDGESLENLLCWPNRQAVLECLWEACQGAAYPFVDDVGQILVKPDLKTFGKWFGWALATSGGTAAFFHTANVAGSGPLSVDGWTSDAATEIAGPTGYHVALRAAERYLPAATSTGGQIVRMLAVAGLGQVGKFAARAAVNVPGKFLRPGKGGRCDPPLKS
jgi:hypothetical protein